MKYYVDQLGKVEDTSKNTVLALSNSTNYTILLNAKDKRRLQELFRKIGYTRF